MNMNARILGQIPMLNMHQCIKHQHGCSCNKRACPCPLSVGLSIHTSRPPIHELARLRSFQQLLPLVCLCCRLSVFHTSSLTCLSKSLYPYRHVYVSVWRKTGHITGFGSWTFHRNVCAPPTQRPGWVYQQRLMCACP